MERDAYKCPRVLQECSDTTDNKATGWAMGVVGLAKIRGLRGIRHAPSRAAVLESAWRVSVQ
eukprot:5125573-Pyramimonas_sp.AAC.1